MTTSMTATAPTPENPSVATPAEQEVLITRVFDAPRDLVFEAWTSAEHLMRWSAPKGCSLLIRSLDFRPGGRFHHCIRIPSGHDCWCTGVYHEIVAPERIVYSIAMSDEDGNRVESADAGKDSDWPAETTVTVTFADLGGKTKLTLHQTVSEALAKRTGAYPSWLEMLDHLAEDLTRA
jgi:uncharacterized protein YndB with AHSA1/START domain